jgi:isoprenylcysteine carboxyl methyltransferase (ICMT) family protein YpbQ
MDMNVEETKVMRILRQPFPLQIMIDQNKWRMWNTSIIWVPWHQVMQDVPVKSIQHCHGKNNIQQGTLA